MLMHRAADKTVFDAEFQRSTLVLGQLLASRPPFLRLVSEVLRRLDVSSMRFSTSSVSC